MTVDEFETLAKKHREKGYSVVSEMYDIRPNIPVRPIALICPVCKKAIDYDRHKEAKDYHCCGINFA